MELFNKNLCGSTTTYKYRGYVSVTTFGADPGKNDSYSLTEEFEEKNPRVARARGISWFKDTIAGLELEGKYFLPFAAPSEFVLGSHATYSVTLSLVIIDGLGEDEFELLGTDEETMNDTLELEILNGIID